ncbi:hypothetical protein [Xanthomonas sp. 3058]|uniref:hypothetical protein n=1 Tax=Xanthomonas sp. 3058 TaxID=3035314 RepID=UPI002DD69FDE|nr:hypothetical protein [Xanthomonas sp. 3058]
MESHFFYDPIAGVANVVFQGMEFLIVNGTVDKMLEGREPLSTTTAAIARRNFALGLLDPITGQDLSNVSAAGVVIYLKAVYDTLHNERAAADSAAQANFAASQVDASVSSSE